MTNHTTSTRKCKNKIWSPNSKQWLLGHAQLSPLFGRSSPLLKPCHRKVEDFVGRAMPGDGTDHITPNRTTQARGILL